MRARTHSFVLWGLFVLWLAGTAAIGWLMLVFPYETASGTYRDVPIELPPKVDIDSLTQRLVEAKMLRHPRAFAVYMRLMGADEQLRSGWVVVNRGLSVHAHLARLARGFGTSSVHVLIPEGFTHFDVATRLERYGVAPRGALLAAMQEPALLNRLGIAAYSAEGYLFPAVYVLRQESRPEDVVARMVKVFRERTRGWFEAYDLAHDGAPFALTAHQLVTLASIVEREARLPDERPIIAGVFMNRLTDPEFKPKRLQADPTVAYGCLIAGDRIPSCKEFDGRRITPAMVRDPENPYSTYRNEGLPPGPICNPGLDALRAALQPASHDYFYFVTKGGGAHAFSHSLGEHNARVRTSP